MEKINEMGEFDLNWGRPLKSILSVYDKKIIDFKFHHLVSSMFWQIRILKKRKNRLIILNNMKIF